LPKKLEGHLWGTLALLAVTITWSTTFAVSKAAYGHLTPAQLTASRFTLSALVLTPRLAGLTRGEVRLGTLLGALQFFCCATVFWGLRSTGAGRSAFLISLSVFLVPLASGALGRPVTWIQAASTVLALAGVGIFTGGVSSFGAGDAWVVLSAAIFAAYMLVIEKAGPQQSPLRLSGFQLVVVAVMSFLWLGLEGTLGTTIGNVVAVWPSVGYLAITAILTTSLQGWGQRYVSAQESAVIFVLEPVLASVWAWIFLGERVAATALPGAALIIVANLWSQLTPRKRRT
jgi:drug/metabolite transporter (DMT)-like permease